MVPDFTGDVTASDNCTTVGNLVITQSPAAGTTVTTGVNVVTIAVTDQAGNETSCDVNFTVVDNTDPVITSCATAESADADGSCEALVPDFTGDVNCK
ncbi:HYR domain-containing protein [uncultured Sunxiuqinia sp.]|uniref:HYR domain-containing protein n=1 Tax=uncultured Sunxiuqinia sp. TaxID=1573825 RepID=UPI002AA82DBD|nr:HYR domain-containing protein [uncultured Sunxiuqinia sp.]